MTVTVASIKGILILKVHMNSKFLVTCLGTLCWFQIGFLFRLSSCIFDLGYKQSFVKRVWDSWVPLPVGVGLSLLAYLQWRRLTRERKGLSVASDWEITCYKALPLKSFSRVFGAMSETKIPTKLRPYVYGGYARAFKANLSEMAEPVEHYSCLCDFFTRKLKDGARPVDAHLPLVSPSDGTVLNSGKVTSLQVEQVKGVTYSLRAFLGDLPKRSKVIEIGRDINSNEITATNTSMRNDDWFSYKKSLLHDPENNDLYQCVVYLAPGDYHRFHSPADWHVSYRKHFPGELLSVNPSIARWIPGLFTLNERALYVGSWQYGYFSMTAVGATNVGSIRVYDDKDLHTNEYRVKGEEYEAFLDLNWTKGAEIGEFRMGSTIVLIFEAPKNFSLTLQPSQRVRVGEGITSHF